MNWLLPKLSLRYKLAALTLVPLLAMAWFQVSESLDRRDERNDIDELNELVDISVGAGDLLHYLQLERGATAVYLSSNGTKFATILNEQRSLTDARLHDFVLLIGDQSSDRQVEVSAAANKALRILESLPTTRDLISAQSIDEVDATDFYTNANAALLEVFSSIQLAADDAELTREIISYSALVTGKEATGLERALLVKIFVDNDLAPGEHAALAGLVARRGAYFEVFAQSASPELLAFFNFQQSNPLVAEVSELEALVLQENEFDVDSSLWFDIMSQRIDLLQEVEDAQSAELTARASELEAASTESIRNAIMSLLLVLVFTLLFVGSIARQIAGQLDSLSDQAEHIAEGNLLVTPLKLRGHDTIAKLSRSFDHMGRTLNLISEQLKAVSTSDLESDALSETVPGELGTAIRGLVAHSRERSELLEDVTAQAIELQIGSRKLELTKNRFETLVQNAFEAIVILDDSENVTYISSPFEQITGIPASDFVGSSFHSFLEFVHPEDKTLTVELYEHVIRSSEDSASGEFRFIHADNTWHWIDLYVRNLLHDESIRGIVINARDVTEKKTATMQLEEHAHHDSLTALPNRRLLENRLDQALAHTARHGGTIALLYLDLDNFKEVNDTMGHDAGDDLLKAVAKRIDSLTRAGDTAARFGGDEFVVLAEALKDVEEVRNLGSRLLTSISEPMEIQNRLIAVTASVGVVVAEDGNIDSKTMLRDADMAMYGAKQAGKNELELFNHRN